MLLVRCSGIARRCFFDAWTILYEPYETVAGDVTPRPGLTSLSMSFLSPLWEEGPWISSVRDRRKQYDIRTLVVAHTDGEINMQVNRTSDFRNILPRHCRCSSRRRTVCRGWTPGTNRKW